MTLKAVFGCLYTGVIFGPFLRNMYANGRKPRLWFGTAAVFVMHCGVLGG